MVKRATLCDIAQSVYRGVGPILARYIWAVSRDIPVIFRCLNQGRHIYTAAKKQKGTMDNSPITNSQTC